MSFYDEMNQVATQVIGEFQQGAVSYVKRVAGSGPADNPGASSTITSGTSTSWASAIFCLFAVGLPRFLQNAHRWKERDSSSLAVT